MEMKDTKMFREEVNTVIQNIMDLMVQHFMKDEILWQMLVLYLAKEHSLHIIDNISPKEYAEQISCSDYSWHVLASLTYDEITDKEMKKRWYKEGVKNSFIWSDKPREFYAYSLAHSLGVNDRMISSTEPNQRIFSHDLETSILLMKLADNCIRLSNVWSEHKEWVPLLFNTMSSAYHLPRGYGDMSDQPKEVSEIVGKVLNAEEGSVYNPYAGIGSYAMLIGEKCNYYGEEINLVTTAIGKLNLLINERRNAEIGSHPEYNTSLSFKRKFDYIVSTPPFGLKLSDYDMFKRTAEIGFLEESSLGARIKSVGVYPASICYKKCSANPQLLSKLIEEDILETVILLPVNIFVNTAIETAIIVVNKMKEKPGFVRFIDASDCFITKSGRNTLDTQKVLNLLDGCCHGKGVAEVSNDDIKANDFKIYPKFYCSVDEVEFPEGYHVVELKDIVEPCAPTRKNGETNGYLAKISDLSNDSLDCERSVESFELSDKLVKTVRVEEPVFLFSMIRDVKPTFCIASRKKPLYVHSNVAAYRLKEDCDWVNPKYLCYELSRRANIVTDGTIPRINREILIRTKVGFPSQDIRAQKLVLDEAIHQSQLAKAKELGLQELIDKMKREYINEVRTRKHDMRPYLRELRSAEKLFRFYLEKRELMPDFEQKMSDLLDSHHKAVAGLSALVDIFSEEENFGIPEHFNIDQYFSELIKSHNSELSGYDLLYKKDLHALLDYGIVEEDNNASETADAPNDSPLFVNIAHVDFERLVKNILVNAREHGFLCPEDNKYELAIHLSVDVKRAMYQIDFVNNGTPLPQGMNKLRYGIRGEKAGMTGGTGNGGYIVKNIVEHYKGDYDVFMNENKTVIRILLPIL